MIVCTGPFNDDEAFKKAFTDAVMNAFKFIGVAADVHMGLFDDSKYVAEQKAEFGQSGQTVSSRKSSAQAKRDGDDQKIKDEIAAIKDEAVLDLFTRQRLPGLMASLPLSWVDPVNDMVELRRDELRQALKNAA